ncbi:hypothetical protein [Pseudoalteromonas aurantia]|uniref:hypothetical protein n=1 Tax=Pseudoalteromonas aurantia TaxID=43654 RepID=UPI001BB2179F|nr:hypothetical protein [Pseudoalteromonas aurantia]
MDFSYYALKTAGLFFFLGITPKEQDPATSPSNHSPHFYIDEQTLPIGVESLTNLTLNYLNTP